MMDDVTCVVLAGGQSRRMGTNKAFVLLDDKPLITHVLDRISELPFAETLIVTRTPTQYEQFSVRVVMDEGTGKGPLNGIYSAFQQCETPYLFVVGCDMPFVDPAWVRWIYEKRAEYAIVVPRFEAYLQSLHALYHRRSLPQVTFQLNEGNFRMETLVQTTHTLVIEEAEIRLKNFSVETFFNVNTPEDLNHAQCILDKLKRA